MLTLNEIEFARQRHQQLYESAQQRLQQQPESPADGSLREKVGDLLIAAGEKLKAQPAPRVEQAPT